MGLELLLIASIDGKYPLKNCDAQKLNLPLTMIPEMEEKSILFKTMPKDIKKILLTEPVTSNHHGYVLLLKNLIQVFF